MPCRTMKNHQAATGEQMCAVVMAESSNARRTRSPQSSRHAQGRRKRPALAWLGGEKPAVDSHRGRSHAAGQGKADGAQKTTLRTWIEAGPKLPATRHATASPPSIERCRPRFLVLQAARASERARIRQANSLARTPIDTSSGSRCRRKGLSYSQPRTELTMARRVTLS